MNKIGLMKKMKIFLSIVVCLLIFNELSAQSYNTALGVRLGSEMGLSIQQRRAKKITIEGIAQYNKRYEESTFTGLIESHMPILFRRFNIYTGIGGHYTLLQSRELIAEKGNYTAGITVVAGLELTIARLNLSWDYKPQINVAGVNTGFRGQSAISVRYVIFKKKNNGPNLQFWKPGNGKSKKKRQKARVKKRKQKEKAKKKV